ncbi:hypothetical protein PLICRDRAFT_96997 [Plicaturopsis crispa FD-325 SS-3]|nr:hypothetical protein PLICRDRAFT_96997 [Plicaturopsis crispa FD-325 SS-3]
MGLTLKGCTSNASFTSSLPSQTETFVNEKFDRSEFTRLPAVAYTPPAANIVDENAALAYKAFLKHFPEYQLTWILDTLRRTDFSRLEQTGEAYCDYMGGSLYPESLIRVHTDFLKKSILGNTHSVSNASKLSSDCASEARAAVLTFFRAPPEYTVIFTANATGALKLVGESFPFAEGSTYVLGADSHNSVHGIRQFATRRGANVCYIDATDHGGFDVAYAKDVLVRSRPRSRDTTPSLFAMTGLSNISNCKNPMSVAQYASSLGYYTLLDAAALAATSVVSLTETPVDAMAISFYKMFGFPTGVGALVVKKSFLAKLQRPWFAGGTVDVVQVPGNIVTMARDLHEQFEDGTINYLNLPAVTDGLRFLSAYQPFLPLRLSSLMHFLTSSLLRLRHDNTDKPVVQILSKLPKRRLRTVGEQADTGSTVSLIFVSASGDMISNAFIEYAATVKNISLRTGCMCNPGGAAAILGVQEDMCQLYPGVTLKDFECAVGRELGVVRISFGLASSFQDVWRVIQFAATIGNTKSRQALWERYTDALGVGRAF